MMSYLHSDTKFHENWMRCDDKIIYEYFLSSISVFYEYSLSSNGHDKVIYKYKKIESVVSEELQ